MNYSALHSSYFDVTLTYITQCCSLCCFWSIIVCWSSGQCNYAANNAVNIYDICDQSTDIANDICDALRRVRDSGGCCCESQKLFRINYTIATSMPYNWNSWHGIIISSWFQHNKG